MDRKKLKSTTSLPHSGIKTKESLGKSKSTARQDLIIKIRNEFLKIINFVFFKFILHLILLFVVNYYLILFLQNIYVPNSILDSKYIILKKLFPVFGYLIIILPSVLYLINIYFHFKKQNKLNNLYGVQTKLYPRNQHFASLVSLLLFYSGTVIFLVLFIPKPPITEIPKIEPGTFGLRAWSCQTTIKDLTVFYQDSNNKWKEISTEYFYNAENWVDPKWSSNKRQTIDTLKHSQHFKIDTVNNQITLNRTGIVFIPKDKSIPHFFKNVMISGLISYNHIAKDSAYPGFQFCINVDTAKNSNTSDIYSEFYLAFDFGLFNESKPWIPLIKLYPSVSRPTSLFKLKSSGLKTKHNVMKHEYEYTSNLSAFRIDNQVRFSILDEYGAAHTLFDAKINEVSQK